jgi:hypothetical protein
MKRRWAVIPVLFLGLALIGCKSTPEETAPEPIQPQVEVVEEVVEVAVGVEQVAIFVSCQKAGDYESGLQNEVNAWLRNNDVEIVRVLQTQGGQGLRSTIISIFYKKTS